MGPRSYRATDPPKRRVSGCRWRSRGNHIWDDVAGAHRVDAPRRPHGPRSARARSLTRALSVLQAQAPYRALVPACYLYCQTPSDHQPHHTTLPPFTLFTPPFIFPPGCLSPRLSFPSFTNSPPTHTHPPPPYTRTHAQTLHTCAESWLSVGRWESDLSHSYWPDYPVVLDALASAADARLRAAGIDGAGAGPDDGIVVFYVCGTDHAQKCGLSRGFGNPRRGVVIVPRAGDPPAAGSDRATLVFSVAMDTDCADLSSSKFHAAVGAANRAEAERIVGPSVFQYLASNSLLGCSPATVPPPIAPRIAPRKRLAFISASTLSRVWRTVDPAALDDSLFVFGSKRCWLFPATPAEHKVLHYILRQLRHSFWTISNALRSYAIPHPRHRGTYLTMLYFVLGYVVWLSVFRMLSGACNPIVLCPIHVFRTLRHSRRTTLASIWSCSRWCSPRRSEMRFSSSNRTTMPSKGMAPTLPASPGRGAGHRTGCRRCWTPRPPPPPPAAAARTARCCSTRRRGAPCHPGSLCTASRSRASSTTSSPAATTVGVTVLTDPPSPASAPLPPPLPLSSGVRAHEFVPRR